ncbi:conserved hypothetical protein [uncultured Pleomorphomonas sp.]|uniref:Uncharacterized protein n=1 Tax=uncultured Pleomorphomonas sp. TaxID=442121 RepID=A0A212L306_9HYPH|nr:hypothetical protein [uncultured Pleomorphomonas sp.]SCM71908.1 conserved hypothetical protein [uncultured Pleomorphomonas sp.]
MGFADARAIYIERASALYRNTGLLNKAVNTLPRHLIFGCALHVHARHAFDPAAPALTLTRLQKLSAEHGGVSPGRVAAQVLLLRKLGFLDTRPADDRRQRLLEPTGKMVSEDHRWLMAQLTPLEPLGLFRLTEAERSTPEFALAFRLTRAATPDEVTAFVQRHPTIAFFITRDGGYSMLLELLWEWQKSGSTSVAFDVMATAGAFCVSKSQIWNLLHAAEAQGLIRTEAPAWRLISLNEQLLVDFDAWFADKANEIAAIATQARDLWSEYRQK